MNRSGVTVLNAIGSITFLLLTLVIYLSLKGRLGVYLALAQAAPQKVPENAGGPTTRTTTPSLQPLAGGTGTYSFGSSVYSKLLPRVVGPGTSPSLFGDQVYKTITGQ